VAVVIPPLPKAGSAAFKELWELVQRTADFPRLVIIIEGALDRGTMEQELQRIARASRVKGLSRGELVGHLAQAFNTSADAAYGIAGKLDKACHKERHIVASIEESAIHDRLQAYRALDFRRERARLVWALLRDGRPGHTEAADKILREAFAAIDADTRAQAALDKPAEMTSDMLEELKTRLKQYESAIEENTERLRSEVNTRAQYERERSELLTRMAVREQARKHEETERRAVEDELRRAQQRISEVEETLRLAAPERLQQAEADVQRLRDKVDALERALDHAADARTLQTALVDTQATLTALQRKMDDDARLHQQDMEEAVADKDALAARLEETRAELRAARQQLAGTPTKAVTKDARIGLFIDDANLSLSARRAMQQRLDYRAVVDTVLQGRGRGPMVVFVVTSEDAARHGGFVRSLRDAGLDVREKRARVRSDGSRKADWDMGIAMEVLDRIDDYDVCVLGTGDGDFLPLLLRLRAHGKRVEVASFTSSSEEALLRAADVHHALDERVALRGER
jgi:uncharacterized LabA/DUF88 family protein